ncbi:DUF7524 family protein [Halocatena halophila]|uniref:DUF7524 family protein n=1 Tax=Halocatena halophila TaxID=2814576 RepID=UPI002ED44C5C
MQGTLTVDVNPDGMHTLDVPESFATDGSFTVELRNHGESTHVYLNLDSTLSEIAQLDATNYYIESGESVSITIPMTAEVPQEGQLTVATAYGSEKRLVRIDAQPASPSNTAVNVDSSLASTRTQRTNGGSSAPVVHGQPRGTQASIQQTLPAVVFGVIAISLAFSSIAVDGGSRVVLGLLALVAGALVMTQLSE